MLHYEIIQELYTFVTLDTVTKPSQNKSFCVNFESIKWCNQLIPSQRKIQLEMVMFGRVA